MSYSRNVLPANVPDAGELTGMLTGIGFRFSAVGCADANIEDALYFASQAGMDGDDLRVLAMLVSWLECHSPRVNADRMIRLVAANESPRVRAFWAAVGHYLERDRRFARVKALHGGSRISLLGASGSFLLKRSGEDSRFEGTPLIVAAGALRSRLSDVLTAEELTAMHRVYRWRVIVGPTYRADMLAHIEQNPSLTAAELARRTYGSFATAFGVKRDWELVRRGAVSTAAESSPSQMQSVAGLGGDRRPGETFRLSGRRARRGTRKLHPTS